MKFKKKRLRPVLQDDDPLHNAEVKALDLIAAHLPAGRLDDMGTLETGSMLRVWSSAEHAESRRFSTTSPAASLAELLDILAAEHRPGFLYRGQVRHYPGLIPSGYRAAMPPGAGGNAVIRLEPDLYREAMSDLDTRRYAALADLVRRYGISLGNILAQQYGLSSEAIDVTGDLQIAGFFATRRYPEYRHWKGAAGNELGVIYRFPYQTDTWGDPANLDAFLSCMVADVRDQGHVFFSHYRKSWDLSDELRERIRNQFAASGGERLVSLFSPHIVVDQEFVRTALPADLDFPATRVGRQRGGFLRPPVHRVCRVAKRVRIRPTSLFKVFDPPFAIGEKIQGVGNSVMVPGLEMFFFTHGDHQVALEPGHLWPPPEEDALYAEILQIAGEDVVDRGYRPF
jgi:hypothetical protein